MTPTPPLSAQSDHHLPDWATRRCDDCGELFLPRFGSLWRGSRPDEHTHGGLDRCAQQAAYLSEHPDALALEVILMHQAIIEAQETLARLVSESDDENWNDEVARSVFSAQHSLDRGQEAQKLVAFEAVPNAV